jgi:hypothetical protein
MSSCMSLGQALRLSILSSPVSLGQTAAAYFHAIVHVLYVVVAVLSVLQTVEL